VNQLDLARICKTYKTDLGLGEQLKKLKNYYTKDILTNPLAGRIGFGRQPL